MAYQVTTWCDGFLITWHHGGETVTWPATDPEGATGCLAALARTGDDPHSSGPQHPESP